MTGDRAEKHDDVIPVELIEEVRNLMELSGQKRFSERGHKSLSTDLGLWKLAHTHTDKRNVKLKVYRCPMCY